MTEMQLCDLNLEHKFEFMEKTSDPVVLVPRNEAIRAYLAIHLPNLNDGPWIYFDGMGSQLTDATSLKHALLEIQKFQRNERDPVIAELEIVGLFKALALATWRYL